MKKVLPILSLALILFACKKSNKTEVQPEEKKYNVSFTVADFNQEVVTLGKTSSKVSAIGDTLKNHSDNLYYYVYNSAGSLVNTINQVSTSATYGTVSDKLPSGNYTVYLAATKGSAGVINVNESNNAAIYPGGGYWNDTFYKKVTFTVGTTDLTQSVRLDRVVGGAEVTLTDVIPSNAYKITILVQNDANTIRLSTGSWEVGVTKTKDFILAAGDKGQANKKFFTHIANTTSSVTLNIRCYDSNNGLIAEKIVNNVNVFKNKKTLLTGSLFNNATNPSAGFTVTVNPIWDVSGTTITF